MFKKPHILIVPLAALICTAVGLYLNWPAEKTTKVGILMFIQAASGFILIRLGFKLFWGLGDLKGKTSLLEYATNGIVLLILSYWGLNLILGVFTNRLFYFSCAP